MIWEPPNLTDVIFQWTIGVSFSRLFLFSRPSYRYSQLSQEDEDLEGSETFKYNPRPKGLRAYRDYETSDDVRSILTNIVPRVLSPVSTDNGEEDS